MADGTGRTLVVTRCWCASLKCGVVSNASPSSVESWECRDSQEGHQVSAVFRRWRRWSMLETWPSRGRSPLNSINTAIERGPLGPMEPRVPFPTCRLSASAAVSSPATVTTAETVAVGIRDPINKTASSTLALILSNINFASRIVNTNI